jgi:hypothetical protein
MIVASFASSTTVRLYDLFTVFQRIIFRLWIDSAIAPVACEPPLSVRGVRVKAGASTGAHATADEARLS